MHRREAICHSSKGMIFCMPLQHIYLRYNLVQMNQNIIKMCIFFSGSTFRINENITANLNFKGYHKILLTCRNITVKLLSSYNAGFIFTLLHHETNQYLTN